MALIKEYFELTKKYQDEYGENTILLMQVGSFFEVYAKNNKKTNNNVYEISFESNRQTLNITKFIDFFKIIKNKPIVIIDIENLIDGSIMTMFRCDTNDCLDIKRWAQTTIKKHLKKSRQYAAWTIQNKFRKINRNTRGIRRRKQSERFYYFLYRRK